MVAKSVTLNELERRNGVISANSCSLQGALHKSSRSLSHLLMCSCTFLYSHLPLNLRLFISVHGTA